MKAGERMLGGELDRLIHRLRSSRIANPPRNSLVSMNGPSVSSVSPSRTRTVVAVAGVLKRDDRTLVAARLDLFAPGVRVAA